MFRLSRYALLRRQQAHERLHRKLDAERCLVVPDTEEEHLVPDRAAAVVNNACAEDFLAERDDNEWVHVPTSMAKLPHLTSMEFGSKLNLRLKYNVHTAEGTTLGEYRNREDPLVLPE